MTFRLALVGALMATAAAVTAAPASASPEIAPSTAHATPTIVDGGGDALCRIEADGGVRCWGRRSALGAPTERDATTARVTGITSATEFAAGDYHGCALLGDGSVHCWGENSDGQLGDGSTTQSVDPVAVTLPTDATSIAAGGGSTCAILSTAEAVCWGGNASGQLGDGTLTDALTPTPVSGLSDVVDIDIGRVHACAVRLDGQVWCWGLNSHGALGNGQSGIDSNVPVKVVGIDDATAVTVGDEFTCALDTSDELSCWGENASLQLGGSALPWSDLPVPGPTGRFAAVDAYGNHACAIGLDGRVLCWGTNADGQIGDGTIGGSAPPTAFALADAAVAIAAGDGYTCAVDRLGATRCAGSNRSGILGSGVAGRSYTAVEPGIDDATRVTVGGRAACALRTDTASCWGYNGSSGSLGSTTTGWVDGPAPVATTPVDEITMGFDHGCARTGSTVSCWGRNDDGQTGQPASSSTTPPTAMAAFGDVVEIDAGTDHVCARIFIVIFTTHVRCWGANDTGQLGDGTTTPTHVPTAPSVTLNARDISAGDGFTCALVSDDTGRCWGHNADGQLGDGTTTDSPNPVTVTGLNDADRITVGSVHACATKNDGTVWCWGSGTSGQLGDGTTNSSTTPVQVSGLTDAVDIAAADQHTCALLGDATAWCWGTNFNGQLGDPTIPSSSAPVRVAVDVADVDVGSQSTCIVSLGGTVSCWGSNIYGQLGAQPYALSPRLADADDTIVLPRSIVPVTPARLLETRIGPGETTIDGLLEGIGRRTADSTTTVAVRGRGGVPDDATAVVLNVAAVQPAGVGFLTFHRCDIARPLVANLNYSGGVNLSNSTVVGLDDDGDTCVYTSGATDLAIDVTGYVPAESALDTDTSARLLDTRDSPTIDGLQEDIGRRAAGTTTTLQVAGRPGVAPGTDLVGLNIVAVDPSAVGFLTLHRCDQPRPLAANLNYAAATIANGATVEVDPNGEVCVYNSAETDLVIDLAAASPPYERYFATTPSRLLETRPGEQTVDGLDQAVGPLATGSVYTLPVAGRAGLPSADQIGAVTINVAAVTLRAVGYLTFFACDDPRPLSSNLNYTPGTNVANTATIDLDSAGNVCIYTFAETHAVVDLTAYTRN